MGSSSNWTARQNQVFEDALATYEKDKPEWWQNVAGAVGKSVDEVKRHFQKLLEDINHIETGKVPIPNYNSFSGSNNNNGYK